MPAHANHIPSRRQPTSSPTLEELPCPEARSEFGPAELVPDVPLGKESKPSVAVNGPLIVNGTQQVGLDWPVNQQYASLFVGITPTLITKKQFEFFSHRTVLCNVSAQLQI